MRLLWWRRSRGMIEVDEDDLIIANNAVNEVCNGVDLGDDAEFNTRIGATRERAGRLLAEIDGALESLRTPDPGSRPARGSLPDEPTDDVAADVELTIRRATAALVPFVHEWNLALNPEDLEVMAMAVMRYARSAESWEGIDQGVRELIAYHADVHHSS